MVIPPNLSRIFRDESLSVWRDLAAGVSLANLINLKIWGMLFSDSGGGYWLKYTTRPVAFAAAGAHTLLLGFLLFLVFRIGRGQRSREPAKRNRIVYGAYLATLGLLTLALLNTIYGLAPSVIVSLGIKPRYLPATGAVLAMGVIMAEFSGRTKLIMFGFRSLLLLAPLVPITFAYGAFLALHTDRNQMADGLLAPALSPPASAPHVVWVIFDEWDEALSFPERPSGLRMPEADRLRTESFYSDVAQTPGPGTDLSMAALTTGREVEGAHPRGPREFWLRSKGTQNVVPWSHTPTVFTDARTLGLNTGVIAWALPYCRVLNASLTGCYWLAGSTSLNSTGSSFLEILSNEPRGLWEGTYRSPFGQSLAAQRHVWLYRELMQRAEGAVAAQRYNLTLLHFNIPHAPFFYNRRTGRDDFDARPLSFLFHRPQAGYVDALALVDRSIGILRRAMEKAGVWDSTTVLFTADHYFRWRPQFDGQPLRLQVPFILKLAHQRRPLLYDRPFSALVTHDLLLAILKKQLASPEEVKTWLDAHRDAFPHP